MVDLELMVGVIGHASTVVSPDNSAVTVGSGTLPVFASPMMAALVEQAAVAALQPYMPLGKTTVGCAIALKHLAATPVGHNVQAEVVVTAVEGRRIEMRAVVFDEKEKIGEGTHERFVVDAENFMTKLALKRPKT